MNLPSISGLMNDEDKDEEFHVDNNGSIEFATKTDDSLSVRDEAVSRDAISDIVLCATKPRSDKKEIPKNAITILLKLNFHENALKKLKRADLLPQLKECLKSDQTSEEHDVEDVQTMIWKLNQSRIRTPNKKTPNRYQIMVSYSHKDREICKKIAEYLKQYHEIWIDYDCMRNRVRDAMAEAVESSKIVIICLSDSYTNSSACRAEAEYAFGSNRDVIPIYVQQNFRIRKGWLAMMINGLNYLDYHKNRADFKTLLDREIDGYLDGFSASNDEHSKEVP